MNKLAIASMAAICLFTAALTHPAAAQSGPHKQSIECVDLTLVDDMPIINDHTILIVMKTGKVHYKRVDLAAPCHELDFEGFSHDENSYNEFCSSEPLRVRAVPGKICKIAKISDISDAEGKDLLAQKNKKR